MKYIFMAKQLILKLIRLVFVLLENGEKCLICNASVYNVPVCKKCIDKYFNVSKRLLVSRCDVCGREISSNINLCSECKENRLIQNIDSMLPIFSYRLWNKELMYFWKIQENRSLADFFSKIINKTIKSLGEYIIVPVPPRKGKIKKNGWDQINDLCQFLQYRYGYTILNLLERTTVIQQKKLNRAERLENLISAYKLTDKNKIKKELSKINNVIPETVVLIDDVSTTGSTLECCAKVLKSIGIKKIKAVTLFTVD